jgi:Tfp pilus assembly protein PilX
MSESALRRGLAGFVSPVCLVLLLLASLLVVRFSESAVLQQRHAGLLAQQLAAERVARDLLHGAPVLSEFSCQISAAVRCGLGDTWLLTGAQLDRRCEALAGTHWHCFAAVDAYAVGGPRAVVHRILQERAP